MLENCIELMLAAFYSQSRTIVRMNIDEDVEACLDFLDELCVNCRIKQANEITVLPVKQLKRGVSIEIDRASDKLAYFLMGLSTSLNLSVKINRLSAPLNKEQVKLFAQSLDNTFVYTFNGEQFVFSSFSASEMPSFENTENDALCAGVVFSAPFKAENVSFNIGKNINGRYVNTVLDKIRLFGAGPEIEDNILFVSSLYKKFVKNKTGENT